MDCYWISQFYHKPVRSCFIFIKKYPVFMRVGAFRKLSILKWECEHITHLPGRSFDFQVRFSENEDFNAVAYEIGDKVYSNISIAAVMQLYHHVLLIMGRNELLG